MEEARTLEIDVVSCIPMLRRYALKLARNGPDADDLVQDCLLRALSRQHQFEPGTNLLAWLTTILRNLFFNTCQRRKRMAEVSLEPDAAQALLNAPQLHRIELNDTGRALEGLSKDQNQVVLRCGVEGASYEDIAQEMGVSVGTIRSRLSRARSYLREQIAGRIGPACLRSRCADVREANTRHYHIHRIERHAACPEDVTAKQPECNEHSRTPAETTIVHPLMGIPNIALPKVLKPPHILEVAVAGNDRILLAGAGFPGTFVLEAAIDFGGRRTDWRHYRVSDEPTMLVWSTAPNATSARPTSDGHIGDPVPVLGLSVEQVGSRGGAPPRLFRSPARAEWMAA
jgi:RNA polymerase sigma-70 factor (ECF subfamily)